MKEHFAISFLFLLLPAVAAALPEDPLLTLSGSLSDQKVREGDLFTLELNAVTRLDGELELVLPDIAGLIELSRNRTEGSSVSWDGTKRQVIREYTFLVEYQADGTGRVTIPPILVRVGTTTATTSAMAVEIAHGEEAESAVTIAKPGSVAPPDPSEGKIFLRYRVDRAQAYLGEQILLDLLIYARPGLNFSVEETARPPALDGFWREIVEQNKRLKRRTERLAGRRYHVYRIWRCALFPLSAAMHTIPPVMVTFGTNRTIFGAEHLVRRSTFPISIEAQPLPSEGRPADFNNVNVGQYRLVADVDHRTVPAGKGVLLQLLLTGKGNIKNARLPSVSEVDGFRVFRPTVSDRITKEPTGVVGEKRAELLLMPTRGGRLEIPALSMSVFNPADAQYETLTTASLRILVEGEPAPQNGTITDCSGPSCGDARAAGSLRPLRFRSQLAPAPSVLELIENPLVIGFFFLPPLLLLLLLASELLYARAKRETPSSRRRVAIRSAETRLSAARTAAENGEIADAFRAVEEALLELASEKCGVKLRGLTTEEIDGVLLEHRAPESLRERITNELEKASYARFAHLTETQETRALLARWQTLLSDLSAWRTP